MNLPSPLQEIQLADSDRILVKRDDLIHPDISGNKWRKLKYNVQKARQHKGLITFGSAFSNHLVATASVCHIEGLPCVGIVRGQEVDISNPTLSKCIELGMEIKPVERASYDSLKWNSSYEEFPDHWVVPEGGANVEGLMGCEELLDEVGEDFDIIAVSMGTGTTTLGLAITTSKPIYSFCSLKHAEEGLVQTAGHLGIEIPKNVKLIDRYHFGGFAGVTNELVEFKNSFENEQGFELDYVYTAKMFFGLVDMLNSGEIDHTTQILVVHTGGLQGNAGIEARYGLT